MIDKDSLSIILKYKQEFETYEKKKLLLIDFKNTIKYTLKEKIIFGDHMIISETLNKKNNKIVTNRLI